MKKKLIVVLSRYVLLNELSIVNQEVFNFNDFENSIINFNSSEYRVYGYADYEDFIYLEKEYGVQPSDLELKINKMIKKWKILNLFQCIRLNQTI